MGSAHEDLTNGETFHVDLDVASNITHLSERGDSQLELIEKRK